jgi:hypothetical protein
MGKPAVKHLPVLDARGPKDGSKLAHISGPAIGVLGIAFLNWLGGVSESTTVRMFAIIVGLLAIAYAVRVEIHIEHLLRTLLRTRSCNSFHALLVALECLVSLAFLAASPYILSFPNRGTELIAAAALAFSVLALGVTMSKVAERYGIKTGTQLASHCWFVRGLRWLIGCFDHFAFFAWLNSLWERNAPPGRVSYLVTWISVGLIAVAAANGPPVIKNLGDDSPVVGTHREPGHSGGGLQHDLQPSPAPIPRPPSREEAPEEDEPSLAELCGRLSEPGKRAAEPARALLYAQWLGVGGLGAITAGCPKPAHLLANGVWYEAGTCNGTLRSLALAAPNAEAGAILLWRPARFALAAAQRGTLESATSSRLTEGGEFYTVTTTAGTSVFIREDVSDGSGGLDGNPRDCGDIHEDPVPFLRLPPALSRLWFERVEYDGVWIWPATETATHVGVEFTFDSTDVGDDRKFTATCASDTDCELVIDGVSNASSGTGLIDVNRLLEIAPPEPSQAP